MDGLRAVVKCSARSRAGMAERVVALALLAGLVTLIDWVVMGLVAS
jgi:hypothetical protein